MLKLFLADESIKVYETENLPEYLCMQSFCLFSHFLAHYELLFRVLFCASKRKFLNINFFKVCV